MAMNTENFLCASHPINSSIQSLQLLSKLGFRYSIAEPRCSAFIESQLSVCRFELPIHGLINRYKIILRVAGRLQKAVIPLLCGGLFLFRGLEGDRQEYRFRWC